MQVFAYCAGRHGAQVLLADPWETVWSVKQRLLERHGEPGACVDTVRPGYPLALSATIGVFVCLCAHLVDV